jgi:predicted  nucleic acid-binding Zn-ribbon protein
MSADHQKPDTKEISVKDKLKALYQLQLVLSEIDKIKTLRGELPLEVQDLEDEIAGLETRLENIKGEIKNNESLFVGLKQDIETSKSLIEKYKEQLDNVRNNREYDFLSKEIEYQGLDIELNEKKIREAQALIQAKNEELVQAEELLNERRIDLEQKKKELDDIVSETRSEEENLREKAKEIEALIEPRLLAAFKRIRKSARNGLAIVTIQRDACSGCFNKIPPQRQMDIKMSKKIIVCEYCGRIMIDSSITEEEEKSPVA